MSNSLHDLGGSRKYLVPKERAAFIKAAQVGDPAFATFCLTLAITGARISEVLAIAAANIDKGDEGIVFRTLKQRGKIKFRLVPIPKQLLRKLTDIEPKQAGGRLWNIGRTMAWLRVKEIMRDAGISEAQCMPKALRHGFAVEAVLKGVPLNILQRWMGHARLETTSIYAAVLGEEERLLAHRTWKSLEGII